MLDKQKINFAPPFARVAELVDALDSKSSDSNIVPVRARPRVLSPLLNLREDFFTLMHLLNTKITI